MGIVNTARHDFEKVRLRIYFEKKLPLLLGYAHIRMDSQWQNSSGPHVGH